MKHDEINHTELDEKVSGYLEDFSFRISRRGAIARLSKLLLGLVGVSIVPGLPIDREIPVSAQGANCSDWEFCGMCGYFCSGAASCCPSGTHGNVYTCPSCTTRSIGSWSLCCLPPEGCIGTTVTYYDCCGGTAADTASCMGSECCNNPYYNIASAPAWCEPYRCTVIALGGECSG